jgi:hypothetical protein
MLKALYASGRFSNTVAMSSSRIIVTTFAILFPSEPPATVPQRHCRESGHVFQGLLDPRFHGCDGILELYERLLQLTKTICKFISRLALGHALWSIWADGSSFEWNRGTVPAPGI